MPKRSEKIDPGAKIVGSSYKLLYINIFSEELFISL
jgi:hypothetical protein